MQLGDVKNTLANDQILKDLIGEFPETKLEDGIKKFINWYKDFYVNN